jgi:hypothetical protein
MATAKQKAAKRPSHRTVKKSDKPKAVVSTAAPKKKIAAKPAAVVLEAPATKESKMESIRRLPGAWAIARQALATLWSRKWLFLGITAVYLVLNVVLVRGFSSGSVDVSSLKDIVSGNFSGGLSQFWTSLSLFTILVTASGTTVSDAAASYQIMLTIFISLAVVWALRQVMAGQNKIRIRDSFYQGMYPLVPVILVCLIIVLELVPFIIGGYIYGLVISNGIAVHLFERLAWGIVLVAGTAVTLYLLSSSVFGLYIVALPDMTPIKSLRSAKDLVKYRRWPILRKLLFLPLGLFIGGAIIMSPILIFATGLSQWALFLLSIIGLLVIHAYMYTLYRELLV